jgi:tetratricopeptide (TPR) repeat protein
MGGAEREGWLDRLEAELENLRAALAWSSREQGRHETGLRLAAALEDFWYMRGYAGEGRRWLEVLLARGGVAAAAVRARAMEVLALLSFYQADVAQALRLFEAAYALHRSTGNVHSATWALTHQARMAVEVGDYQRATTLLERVLPAHRKRGDRHGIGWTLCYLAQIRHLRGDYARAAALFEEGLAQFEALGDKYGISDQLCHLAAVARDLGNQEQATRLYRASLRVRRALLDKPGFADCFEGLAVVAVAAGQPVRAARLGGAASGLREATGWPVHVLNRTAHDRMIAEVHAALGEEGCAAAWAAGQALGLEEAIALALDDRPCPP